MAAVNGVVIRSNAFGPIRLEAGGGLFGGTGADRSESSGLGGRIAQLLQLEVQVDSAIGPLPAIAPWGKPWAHGDLVAAGIAVAIGYVILKAIRG